MNEQEISYALAKQVPDMNRGFTIHTTYGDLVIEPGPMADRIARQVGMALRVEDIGRRQDAARLSRLGA